MDSSRRTFIKNSALVVAGAAIMPNALFAESKKADQAGYPALQRARCDG